ncbi:MAG: retropepsin-like aspartic protease [Desulfobacterales bacterium]
MIRFPAGSGKVSLSARVNTRADIEFLVDTGASMVTIPSAAARQLGIHVSASTPKERLVTAGGVIAAPRVTLMPSPLTGGRNAIFSPMWWIFRNSPASGFGIEFPEPVPYGSSIPKPAC